MNTDPEIFLNEFHFREPFRLFIGRKGELIDRPAKFVMHRTILKHANEAGTIDFMGETASRTIRGRFVGRLWLILPPQK